MSLHCDQIQPRPSCRTCAIQSCCDPDISLKTTAAAFTIVGDTTQRRLLNFELCFCKFVELYFFERVARFLILGHNAESGPGFSIWRRSGEESVPNSVPNRKSSPANVKHITNLYRSSPIPLLLNKLTWNIFYFHLDFPLRDPLLLLLSGLRINMQIQIP